MSKGNCIHFTGVGGPSGDKETCAAGVNYRAHVGGPAFGWMRRLPCLPSFPQAEDMVPCTHFRAMTKEEHDERQAKLVEKALSASSIAIRSLIAMLEAQLQAKETP